MTLERVTEAGNAAGTNDDPGDRLWSQFERFFFQEEKVRGASPVHSASRLECVPEKCEAVFR
jgi:hypothetical protein